MSNTYLIAEYSNFQHEWSVTSIKEYEDIPMVARMLLQLVTELGVKYTAKTTIRCERQYFSGDKLIGVFKMDSGDNNIYIKFSNDSEIAMNIVRNQTVGNLVTLDMKDPDTIDKLKQIFSDLNDTD